MEPIGDPSIPDSLDSVALGFMCGLEIHQQLATAKLDTPCAAASRRGREEASEALAKLGPATVSSAACLGLPPIGVFSAIAFRLC